MGGATKGNGYMKTINGLVVFVAYAIAMAVLYPMIGFILAVAGLIDGFYISRPDIRLGWVLVFYCSPHLHCP